MKQRIFSVDTEGPESLRVGVGNCGIRVQDLGVQRHGRHPCMHQHTSCHV